MTGKISYEASVTTAVDVRVLDGLACARCGAEPVDMIPDGFGERGQLFRCANGCEDG